MAKKYCSYPRPHDVLQNRVSPLALLDVIAYLTYEAAISSGEKGLGCVAIGLVGDNKDDLMLATAANSGSVQNISLCGSQLCYGKHTFEELYKNRKYAEEKESEVSLIKKMKMAEKEHARIEEGIKKQSNNIYGLKKTLKMGRGISKGVKKATVGLRRLGNALNDTGNLLDGGWANYKTVVPDYAIRKDILSRTETILTNNKSKYARALRALLVNGKQIKIMAEEVLSEKNLHAEMALTSVFLHANCRFLYIGIDKLTCYSCFYVLQGLYDGGVINSHYRTAPVLGTHGHVFANWRAPEIPLKYVFESVPSPCPGCSKKNETVRQIASDIEGWKASKGNVGIDKSNIKVQTIDPYAIFALYD